MHTDASASKLATALAGVFLVALAVIAVVALYLGVKETPVLIAALIAGFASLGGLIWQRRDERKREDKMRRLERLAPIYDQLVRLFLSGGSKGQLDEAAVEKFMKELAQKLILWGDPDVILAFNRWRSAADEAQTNDDGRVAVAAFFELIADLRSDLGQSNEGLNHAELLKIILKPGEDTEALLG